MNAMLSNSWTQDHISLHFFRSSLISPSHILSFQCKGLTHLLLQLLFSIIWHYCKQNLLKIAFSMFADSKNTTDFCILAFYTY